MNIDVGILTETAETAVSVIESLGLQAGIVRAADLAGGPMFATTLEDVVVAKLYALRAVPMQAKDLADLRSIFRVDHEFEMPYLAGQLRRFQITLPRDAKPFFPEWVSKLLRDMRRAG